MPLRVGFCFLPLVVISRFWYMCVQLLVTFLPPCWASPKAHSQFSAASICL
jgi:hypothetical protein